LITLSVCVINLKLLVLALHGAVFNNNLVRAFIQWPIINTNRENQLSKFSLQLPKKFFLKLPTRHHTTALTFNASSGEQIEARKKTRT
jgi:hypothetical protein